jgi:DHA1 family inner membrane transport protein
MAVASAAASAWLPPRHLKWIAILAIAAVMSANLLTVALPAGGIIAARGLSGLGNGLLLWILVGMMTRSAVPARLFAIFVTAQASLGFLLSLVLASFAIARFGVVSGYVALIALNALLIPIIRFMPTEYADLGEDGGKAGQPPPWGLLALGAIVVLLAGTMAFWVYSVPLGVQAGIAPASIRMIVGIANGGQILAGLAAIAMARRLTGLQAVTITTLAGIAAMLATMIDGSILIWLPAVFVFAFCWMFGPPFHIPFLLAVDPTRRTAMFVSTAQLVGMAIGPMLASTMVTSTDYKPARLAALACFGLTIAIAAATRMQNRTRPTIGVTLPAG